MPCPPIPETASPCGTASPSENLLRLQTSRGPGTPAELGAARRSARLMDVDWVLVWQNSAAIGRFLPGFRFAYRADGVSV
jgi:hypothetical protein